MSLRKWLIRGGDGAREKLGESRTPQSADTSSDWKMVGSRWTDFQHLRFKDLNEKYCNENGVDTLLIANYSAIFLLGGFDKKIA